MNLEAVRHTGTYPDIYPRNRKTLVITLRTAKRDVVSCQIHFFSRTDPGEKKSRQMTCVLRDGLFDYYRAEVEFSKVARYQKYYFTLEEDGDIWYYSAWEIQKQIPEDGYFEFLYANFTGVVEVPEWSRGQVFYQIFPDRFYNGNPQNNPPGCMEWESTPTRENYMGGDLPGIIRKLDYIERLGIDCIYLNPIFEADFNHKYATTDYFRIAPGIGEEQDLHSLVANAHQKGMKVILDGVFNHVGIHFSPFADVLKHQANSRYKDWFYITKFPVTVTHHCYECVGAYKYMPKLNTSNPEVRKFVLAVMDYWIREYRIDGWRLDVADEVDESVWTEARYLLKQRYPQILLLGETWGNGLRLMDGRQMDCIMNYVFRDAVRDFAAYGNIDAPVFDARIQTMLASYPEHMNQAMFLPLDSHDTERFSYYCGGNKRKLILAVIFQMTFVGSPSVYYGDEVGISGGNDPDCRRCMIWDEERQDKELLELYRYLIKLRKELSCIRFGRFAVNLCEERVYGFIRYDEEEEVYIVINAGEETQTVEVPVFYKSHYVEMIGRQEYDALEPAGQERFLNSDIRSYEGRLFITLEPFSAEIIKRRD